MPAVTRRMIRWLWTGVWTAISKVLLELEECFKELPRTSTIREYDVIQLRDVTDDASRGLAIARWSRST